MSFKAALLIFCIPLLANALQPLEELIDRPKLITSQKQIVLKEFPDAYNPSLLKVKNGYLLSFRFQPDRESNSWLSFIGIVELNEEFDPISKPQLLPTRVKNSRIQSQSEDARLFYYRGRIFLTYNDNNEVNFTTYSDRRDIFIAELKQIDNRYTLSPPIKLIYENKTHILWQKNWIPFEYQGKLLMSYSINPHEVLYINLINGMCYPSYETKAGIDWEWGTLRGSTPPELIDGEYLAFFHSGMIVPSNASWGWPIWHYFMGAYTFSATPPFALTRISPAPIIAENFYTESSHEKRVIFPGGFCISGDEIHVAYGKDDYEIWIATIDKIELIKSLKPMNLSQ